jgi:hypothetical protein
MKKVLGNRAFLIKCCFFCEEMTKKGSSMLRYFEINNDSAGPTQLIVKIFSIKEFSMNHYLDKSSYQ